MDPKSRYQRYVGKTVRFRTPYGVHKGIVERVTDNEVILLSPKTQIPKALSHTVLDSRVGAGDIALAYGGAPGGAWGGGYAPWGFWWSRWAVSFLIIFALWGLWFW